MTAAGRQRPRLAATVDARARTLRGSRRYLLVLVFVAASFVFTAAAPDAGWARGVLLLIESATLAVALWTSRAGGLAARLLFVGVAVVLAAVQLETSGRTLTSAASVLAGAFVVATIVVIARGVIGQREVNEQAVVGAVCIYLLLGMLFTFVYSVAAVYGAGPFFAQGTDGTTAVRLYFSFVTLTTVGYGDYSPASDVGHTLSNAEALVGQLYLVTVVAILVGRMARGRGQ
jgi:voltage-gated potassium channel